MTYLDLSHQISVDTPVYPGDPKIKIEEAGVLSKDGFQDSLLSFGTHVGTHIDAPAHMIEGGKTLDAYPIERFTGTAICVEGFELPGDLDGIDAIFFYTGASDRYNEKSYWQEYEVMPKNTFKYLLKTKISIVGVDAGSVDNKDGFPIHKELLSNDILIIENLANLKPLVGKTFEFTALPLNLALDGSPCRVIAKI